MWRQPEDPEHPWCTGEDAQPQHLRDRYAASGTNVPDDLSRQMRASYYFLGALLSRFGKAQVAMPGGCNLGPRPIDQHLKVFSALGAEDSVDYGMITVRAKGAERCPYLL